MAGFGRFCHWLNLLQPSRLVGQSNRGSFCRSWLSGISHKEAWRGCRRNQIEDSAAARVQPSAFSDQLSFPHSASRWVHPQSRDIRVGAADLGAKYEYHYSLLLVQLSKKLSASS